MFSVQVSIVHLPWVFFWHKDKVDPGENGKKILKNGEVATSCFRLAGMAAEWYKCFQYQ